MSRAPSRPPDLAGCTVVRHLGGGGFADVFLYHQRNLDRDVAVKVLLGADSTPGALRRFEIEGQVMARLSEEHQNIVPVYDAAICADGRPYLVMQYCPRDDLSKRYKNAPIKVAEVLSIGVQLAGAVESAHRQGILHRDIKPANVLTKRSGRPALTDFGIAVSTASADDPESVGVSIPWSPPELLADDPVGGGMWSDVYSLTATLYTLLARRSPFELPGQSNELVDLLSRIPRIQPPPTGNPQTPRSLERLLAHGLAKDPNLRFPSALVLARALQEIETELNGAVTNFEFLDENPAAALAEIPGEQADHTRIRPVVIRAQTSNGGSHARVDSTRLRPPPAAAHPAEQTRMRGKPTTGAYLDPQYLSEPVAVDTVVQVRPEPPAQAPPAPRKSRRIAYLIGSVAIVVAGALTWIVIALGVDPPAGPAPTPTPMPIDVVVPLPADLTGAATADGIVFSWTNPDPQPGDSFDWRRSDLGSAEPVNRVAEPTALVSAATAACIEVVLIRDNGTSSFSPATACVGK